MRERLNAIFEKLDHSFGMDNYHYVLEKIKDTRTKDIYKKLGPFDHFEYAPAGDETSNRNLRINFDTRKSGAEYRG